MTNGPEEEKVEVPQEELAFTQLLQKFGIGTKTLKTETIAENISRTGGERVFEYPERLAERLATWHEYISPVKRKQVLEQWFSEKGVEVPEAALKTASVKTSEIREKEKEEETKKAEEEKRKAKFFVEPDTGAIRAAKGEETALTMAEAETLSDRIKTGKKEAKEEEKAEAEKKAADEGGKEPPFTLDTDGHWQLNPNAKISGMELLAFEAVKKSQEKGETADPFEILAAQAERIATMRSVFGGGKEGGGFLDSVEDLLKIKELFGADKDTQQLLAGIYKKITEEGAGKGESEDVKGLREDVKSLREEVQQREKEKLEGQITTLTNSLTEIRTDLVRARTEARATDEYGIMSEAIKMVDRRLGALEGTVRGVFGRPPGLLPAGVKEELTQAISEEAVEAQALDDLAEKVFYR